MTTPDTKMLNTEERAIERLNEFAAGERGPYTNIVSDIKTSIDHISALTTRVAELETALRALDRECETEALRGSKDRIAKLESELAAARAPVEESEIAAAVAHLTKVAAVDARYAGILSIITRLARERDEARTLLTTCADAFCDAAQLIDGHKGDDWSNWDEQARSKITNCLSSIRALKPKGGA